MQTAAVLHIYNHVSISMFSPIRHVLFVEKRQQSLEMGRKNHITDPLLIQFSVPRLYFKFSFKSQTSIWLDLSLKEDLSGLL